MYSMLNKNLPRDQLQLGSSSFRIPTVHFTTYNVYALLRSRRAAIRAEIAQYNHAQGLATVSEIQWSLRRDIPRDYIVLRANYYVSPLIPAPPKTVPKPSVFTPKGARQALDNLYISSILGSHNAL